MRPHHPLGKGKLTGSTETLASKPTQPQETVIKDVLVLGGGTAGMLAAISLKVRLPQLNVRVLRSPSIGVIGVGEGSTPDLPRHLHSYLGIDPGEFLRQVRPTWKLGIRFEWGHQLDHFNYSFGSPWSKRLRDRRLRAGVPIGFLAEEAFNHHDVLSSLMEHGKIFPRNSQGELNLHSATGYHVENEDLVNWLEYYARSVGVTLMDGDCTEVRRGPHGVDALLTTDGSVLRADLFIDASGFRAELISKALGEPYLSYADTLFCDRALVGGWTRSEREPILPYTTAETMRHGWAWRIEHHERIHRGYVYASAFISDEEAECEFRARNPQLGALRVVRFSAGRRRQQWSGNVFAVGNAAGFVEPLEATSLMVICNEIRNLIATLSESDLRPTPGMQASCNRFCAEAWDEIRDFLSIHYRFNQRLDTPFWRTARAETALHGAERIVEYYRENGPATIAATDLLRPRQSIFGLSGYWTMLLGQGVPHSRRDILDDERRGHWRAYTADNDRRGQQGATIEEAFLLASGVSMQWPTGFYGPAD